MKTLFRTTRVVAEAVAVGLFSLVLLLQAVNILLRYTKLLAPLSWVEELSTFSFVWILFLLWHLADRQGEHFEVDVVSQRLSHGWQRRLAILGHGVGLAFAALVVWSSISFIPTTMLYRTNSFDWLPMGVIYLVIPLGMLLVALERLRLLIVALKNPI